MPRTTTRDRGQELKDVAYKAVRTSGELETPTEGRGPPSITLELERLETVNDHHHLFSDNVRYQQLNVLSDAWSRSTEFTSTNKSNCLNKEAEGKYCPPAATNNVANILHFVTLAILGSLSWGIWWCAGGGGRATAEAALRLTAPPALGWLGGRVLAAADLPAQPAPLLAGVLAAHLGYLDMRQHPDIDYLLRKIYPVVILGKASLGWDLTFMRRKWALVAALGVLPWTAEVLAVTLCTNIFLDFPYVWGVILGSIYASLSCAVVMPLMGRWKEGMMSEVNWPQLVCTAGGLDTALSVGVCGLMLTYEFQETSGVYRYVKASLTLLMGVTLGAAWGSLARFIPHKSDFYVSELRVLYVLLGGLFLNFITLQLGWGGTGGVAVLACNAMAARQWSHLGWTLGKNPATTAYRVFWDILEPVLFTYTGTYFVMNKRTGETLLIGLAVLAICLTVRLATAWLVCWNFTLKEKIYLCCTWIPKTIVEAVLCPVILVGLPPHRSIAEAGYAEDIITLIVQAIFITTPIGYILTKYVGNRLFPKHKSVECVNGL